MKKSLVIVESPAKAKTITKFLGPDYEVTASMGHVMDLPKSSMGVDVTKDFEPRYVVISRNKKTVSRIKKEAKGKERIYLAPDPDREGEAISWHLANILGNSSSSIHRVVFNEITRRAVKKAFENPREIDMNKVNAQQARRILDRIVGYNLSPLLWKKVGRGLSAGRVQSVVLRLICDRENEINSFKPQEYWVIEVKLSKMTNARDQMPEGTELRSFIAALIEVEGKKPEISNQQQSEAIVSGLKDKDFIVDKIEKKEKKRNPSPPFITSKLQQEGYNRLHFSVHKTMQIAQQLYEGIEIGDEGSVGLITYMRTDSVRVSADAEQEAKTYIEKTYGTRYIPASPMRYKSRKGAQEAHEAIRPTSVQRTPEFVSKFLTPDQHKLYHLIWSKFVASRMSPALISTTTVEIKAGECLFRANGSSIIFDGWMIVLDEKKSPVIMPSLEKDEKLLLDEIMPGQHFTKAPPHYTDASLIKTLEEQGIGRPSTYAPIIRTILTRDYVRRDSGAFLPTELGTIVSGLLVRHFPKILNEGFTAEMEVKLDEIEEGNRDWVSVLKAFYFPFMEDVKTAQSKMRDVKKEVIPTSEVCKECGRPMVIKWGAHGRFLACSGFPECKYTKSITTGVKCPMSGCDGELVERHIKGGRFFYGCSNWPGCKHTTRKLPEE